MVPRDAAAIDLVARTMLSLYGGQAVIELRNLATAALDRGDLNGFQGWQVILQAVREASSDTSPRLRRGYRNAEPA